MPEPDQTEQVRATERLADGISALNDKMQELIDHLAANTEEMVRARQQREDRSSASDRDVLEQIRDAVVRQNEFDPGSLLR